MNNILNIHSTPIYHKSCPFANKIKPLFYDYINDQNKSYRLQNGKNDKISHYTGNDRTIMHYEDFFEFNAWCEEMCDDYVKNILGYKIYESIITVDSWINVSNSGGSQYSHNHCNSYISGTYYINYIPEKHAPLSFYRPNYAVDIGIKLDIGHPTVYNTEINISPDEGTLILWPSYVNHGYENNQCDDRISISMNFMPTVVQDGTSGYKVVSYTEYSYLLSRAGIEPINSDET